MYGALRNHEDPLDTGSDRVSAITASKTWNSTWIDDIDSDWKFRLPFHLTLFGSLPEEVLLLVFTALPLSDLLALACVCQRLRNLSEAIIYRHPILTQEYGTLQCFYKTISESPTFGKLVKRLELKLIDRAIDILRPHPNPVTQFHTVEIRERAIAKLIAYTPSLQHLRMSFWQFPLSADETHMCSPIQGLLGSHFNVNMDSLSSTPGFQNLKTLYYDGSAFHYVMCIMHHLERLELSCHCEVQADERPSDMSSLKHLKLPCWSSILIPGESFYQYLGCFLGHFPSLTSVDLPFVGYNESGPWGWPSEGPGPQTEGSYEVVISKLTAVGSTIEFLGLGLKDCQRPTFFDFTNPIPVGSLLPFAKLKTIIIPYEALFDLRDESGRVFEDITKILPNSIEYLQIFYPTTSIYDIFHQSLEQKSRWRFPSLSNIELCCFELRGDNDETFAYRMHNYPVWRDLLSANVSVGVTSSHGYWNWD